ncbi:MAG: ATP-binding protein [Myxococcota bacterium]|nr:ATP-binding protein [Myxococcota bacterium]
MAIVRDISPFIVKDLKRKMVFVGGPRQVGKTTMARTILHDHFSDGSYFNWDYDEDRQAILGKKWTDENPLLVFDELHKHPRWKSWLKGIYDVSKDKHRFLVTGSARLDIYRRGGDSLMGRYHYWRLHPFTLDEIPQGFSGAQAMSRLIRVGGFPEPFLDGDEREARRWRRERFDRVIREDIRDLDSVRNIATLSIMLDLLRTRVGGMIVVSNLAQDLDVSPKTVKSWLEIFERMYLVFSVKPYTRSLPRAVKKPPKVYFFDNADVLGEEGPRFENLVATTLLRRLHFKEDREGYRYELRYLRDKEGREVDFVILKDGELEELIEVKHADDTPSKSLKYYAEKLRPKRATQIVANIKRPYDRNQLRVIDPISYFQDTRHQFFG